MVDLLPGCSIKNQKSSINNCPVSVVKKAIREEAPPRIVTRLLAVTPLWGRFHDPASRRFLYLSASLAAWLNIFTNISRVSFPVWVF